MLYVILYNSVVFLRINLLFVKIDFCNKKDNLFLSINEGFLCLLGIKVSLFGLNFFKVCKIDILDKNVLISMYIVV